LEIKIGQVSSGLGSTGGLNIGVDRKVHITRILPFLIKKQTFFIAPFYENI
jgi:hypothetical protein